MINLLDGYIQNSLPESGDFLTNQNLRMKVNEEGQLLPFFGNTTVFLLSDAIKDSLKLLQEELYVTAGEILAQKLNPETFHVTLHDLVNGLQLDPCLSRRMADTEQKTKALLKNWRGNSQIRMNTTWLFNMVNTSVVLGLAPANEESRNMLTEMYTALETVVPLGYGLTPHITMAYYRPGSYSCRDVQKLKKSMGPVDMEITLKLDDLVYQEFSDMNHYVSR